jgi:hypothetical protein
LRRGRQPAGWLRGTSFQGRSSGPTLADIVFHNEIGGAADHDQVLNIIAAHQEQAASVINGAALQHSQAAARLHRMSRAVCVRPPPRPETIRRGSQADHNGCKDQRTPAIDAQN